MGQVKDILNGHLNELTNKNENLFKERMEICKRCPLYKDSAIGPLCNNKLYINNSDKKTVINFPKIGYIKGCGCRLSSKTRLVKAKCIINKW